MKKNQPDLSANGAAHTSLGQRPRSRADRCQRLKARLRRWHRRGWIGRGRYATVICDANSWLSGRPCLIWHGSC